MVKFIAKKVKTFAGDKKGVTMLEYGLMAALIGVAALTSLGTLSTKLNTLFSTTITNAL